MKDNNWNFTFPESFLETLKELNKIQVSASALAISQAWKATVPDYKLNGAFTALSEIAASQKAWREMILPTSSLSEMMAAAYPTLKVDVSSVAQSVLAQIDTSALDALRESASMAALAKADWSWLSEVYSEWEPTEADELEDVPEHTTEEIVTPEICAQIESDVSEMLSSPDRAQETFQRRYAKWKEENPFLADLYILILLPILVWFLCKGGDAVIGRLSQESNIYNEPSTNSTLVVNISGDQNVTIIGDVTDYYEIEFVNPETGELSKGYIDKGNVITEEQDETEVSEEATEATEEPETAPDVTENQTEPSE